MFPMRSRLLAMEACLLAMQSRLLVMQSRSLAKEARLLAKEPDCAPEGRDVYSLTDLSLILSSIGAQSLLTRLDKGFAAKFRS